MLSSLLLNVSGPFVYQIEVSKILRQRISCPHPERYALVSYNMPIKTGVASIFAITLASVEMLTRAHAGPGANPLERCQDIVHSEVSNIPDAPTQVVGSSHIVESSSQEYCEVRGYVVPNVGFSLRLPLNGWNGKLIEVGCGGACGSMEHAVSCKNPLHRGYACIVSDGGHRSTQMDMKWAYNNPQAVIEYLVGASHVTALAAKALVARFYQQAPKRSYFLGCSAGGVQAMLEAQRFPWDFDGIVAGGPALNLSGLWMNFLWDSRAMTGKNGGPLLGSADLELIHRAVVSRCDLNDGVKDGLIGDPRRCRFDVAELRCTNDRNTHCLSPQQVQAAEKIYSGPITSKGEQIVPPIALKGSERLWWAFDPPAGEADPNSFYNYFGDWFRYYLFQPNPGPEWKPDQFDFDGDFKRLGVAEITEPFNDPDLRRLKAAGGKLLSYTGWADPVEGVLRTVDYYEAAERVVGGRSSTQDFFRLFVIPGMGHCGGGEGAFAVDYLSYLEDWVEKGIAPAKLIGFHITDQEGQPSFPLDPAAVEFSRPIYPYPTEAVYLGHGDPKDAASFGPIER